MSPKWSFGNNLDMAVKDRPGSTSYKLHFSLVSSFTYLQFHKGKAAGVNNSDGGLGSLLLQAGVTQQSRWGSSSLHQQQSPLIISCICVAVVSWVYGSTASAIRCKTIYSLGISPLGEPAAAGGWQRGRVPPGPRPNADPVSAETSIPQRPTLAPATSGFDPLCLQRWGVWQWV